MHKLAFGCLMSLALSLHCEAAPTLLKSDRASLLEESSFHLLQASTPLPAEATRFCADGNGRFAMPGARWAATDVASPGDTLPSRRLIWVASSRDFLVVHFERGGFAHTYSVVVLRISHDPTGYVLAWRASAPRLKDYPNFVRALQADDLRDESN